MKKILLLFCFTCGLIGYGQDCLNTVDFGADTSLEDFFLNPNNYTAGYIKDINGNMAKNDLVRNETVCVELAQNVTFLNLSGSANRQGGGILQPGDNPEIAAPGLNITSMEGISAFTGLQYLYAINNNFTTIDLTSNAALIDFRGFDGNGGRGPLQTVNLRGLNNLEVIGLNNNMITEIMLEGNTSLLRLDARNNQLVTLNLTDATALDRTGLEENPITCIQVANQITADNYNANSVDYLKDAGASFGIDCIYDVEVNLGHYIWDTGVWEPQERDGDRFYVIDDGREPPTLRFDALDSGGMQVTPAELPSYGLIINTLESTTRNPATGGPAPLVRGDGSDFALITNQDITVNVVNSAVDNVDAPEPYETNQGEFEVDIEGDNLFEADEFFVIEVSTAAVNINLLNADLDGVVRFYMRVDDTNDTASASLTKVQDGVEGLQDIQYQISMTKTNDTRQNLDFVISIGNIDTNAGDYTNVTQATIQPGRDFVVVDIPVTPDAVVESIESLQVTLSYNGPFASRLTITEPGPITATITDNTQCTNAVEFTDTGLELFFLDPNNYSSGYIRGATGNLTRDDLVINDKVCIENADKVTFLNLSGGPAEPFDTESANPGIGITSLDGLENFINLEYLYAQNNPIVKMDLRANTMLRDLRSFKGNVGIGVLEYVDLRGLSNLEVVGLTNNVINQLLLEDNTSLKVLHAEDNRLTGNLDISTFEGTLLRDPILGFDPLLLRDNQLSCIKVNDLANAQTRFNVDWRTDDINLFNTNCENPQVEVSFLFSSEENLEGNASPIPQLVLQGTVTTATTISLFTSTFASNNIADPATDYDLNGGASLEVQIPAGVYTADNPIAVTGLTIIDDNDYEGNEVFFLEAFSTSTELFTLPDGLNLNGGSNLIYSYTILEDDYRIEVLGGNNATENGENGSFIINLTDETGNNVSNASGQEINIDFLDFENAIQGTDYSIDGFGAIPNSESSTQVIVTPIDDNEFEGEESVGLEVQPGTGYFIEAGQPLPRSSISLLDNDDNAVLLAVQTGTEGTQDAAFTIALQDENGNAATNGSGVDLEFQISLATGTGAAPASLGVDFENGLKDITGNTISIQAGESSANFEVVVVNDDIAEQQENFLVNVVESPTDLQLVNTQAIGLISDNDFVGGTDTDDDGILDTVDNCPTNPNPDQADLDNDTIGDVCDPDIDGDGANNADDAFPEDATETNDNDGDDIGDNADMDDDNDGVLDTDDTCPLEFGLLEDNGCPAANIDEEDIQILVLSETCPDQNNGSFEVSINNQPYTFNVLLDGALVGTASFGADYTQQNLADGSYQVCLTVPQLPNFEQCFGVNINTFERLNVSSSGFDTTNLTASYLVEGSKSYEVMVNGKPYSFSSNSTYARPIEVPLVDATENEIIITGVSDCQGIFKESIIVANDINAFPNPVINNLNIQGIPSSENIEIAVFSISGQLVKRENFKTHGSNTISFPMYDLPKGVYILRGLGAKENTFDMKVIKK